MDSLTPEQRKQQLIQSWEPLSNWEDRYKKLIEMGKSLPAMPDELKTEFTKVRGCQSQVWITSEKRDDGKIYYQGDSDAILVKGLVALVLYVYSGSTADDILKTSPDFVKVLGFESHLTPSRTNGLYAMIKRIIMDAYSLKSQSQSSPE